jgi:hypothetical protein
VLSVDELQPGLAVEFTGPERPGEHELLKPGARLTIERYNQKGILARFFYQPQEFVRLAFEGNRVPRLVRFDPMRKRLEEDRAARDKAVQEYYEEFKGPIDSFTERSKTDREREEEARLSQAAAEREAILRKKFPDMNAFPAEPMDDMPPEPSKREHPFGSAEDQMGGEPVTEEARKRVETWRKLQQLRLRGKV